MNVANILTIIRLILTPIFVAFFLLNKQALAVVTFSVAGFTDLIDGSVARLLKQPSNKGAILDPVADKCLIQSCFICLLISGILPWYFFFIAVLRDFLIVVGIFYLEYKNYNLPYRAILTSKIATVFQITVAIAGILLWWQPKLTILTISLTYIFSISIFTALFFIILSGLQYIFLLFKTISTSKSSKSEIDFEQVKIVKKKDPEEDEEFEEDDATDEVEEEIDGEEEYEEDENESDEEESENEEYEEDELEESDDDESEEQDELEEESEEEDDKEEK